MEVSPPTPKTQEELAPEEDLYQILGVPKDATEKQISVAYKKLALKYHPDRNIEDEVALGKYKAVQEAFQTLSDPSRRQHYDNRSLFNNPSSVGQSTIDEDNAQNVVSNGSENVAAEAGGLGGIGRVFGAVFSRLGSINISPSVTSNIIETAQGICKNGGIEGGGPPLDPRVTDLAWGWPVEGKAERQTGVFYRLTVDAAHREAGFFLHARSANKDKFKLIVFDKNGTLLFSEDCHRGKTYSFASLFFTSFDTYSLPDLNIAPSSLSSSSGTVSMSTPAPATSIPLVLTRLEELRLGSKALEEGQYLVCIYGENFMSKTSFVLTALRANTQAVEIAGIEETDDQLVEMKTSLSQLKTDYLKAKESYDAICEKVKNESEKVEILVQRREQLYGEYVDGCIAAFAPQREGPTTNSTAVITGSVQKLATNVNLLLHALNGSSHDSQGKGPEEEEQDRESGQPPDTVKEVQQSSSNPLNTLASNTISAASAVSSNAQAAGGWLARRFSLGLQSIVPKAANGTQEEAPVVSNEQLDAATTPTTPAFDDEPRTPELSSDTI